MNNIKYFPVSTVADLNSLDDAEILAGYRHGWDNDKLPQDSTRSFWHGFNNARRDKTGRRTKASSRLASEFVKTGEGKAALSALSGVMGEFGLELVDGGVA